MRITSLLFVCLGNICRSPLAEAVCWEKIRRGNLEDALFCDSCGTIGYHQGAPPDPRSIAVARRYGVSINHRARKLEQADFDKFDLLLVMDRQNYSDVFKRAISAGYQGKIVLLRSFDPTADEEAEVPDPYYGGYDGFENVYWMLDRAVEGLLLSLKPDREGASN